MMNRKEHEKNVAGQRSVLTRVRDRFSVRNLKRVLAGTVALLMAVLVAGMATPLKPTNRCQRSRPLGIRPAPQPDLQPQLKSRSH